MAANARGFQRFPGTIGPLTVRPDPASPAFAAPVRDFSIMGIGLLVDHPVSPGTSLAIESGRFSRPADPLAAEVRHVTQLPDGHWLLGCQFSRYLTLADLSHLR